MEPYRPYVDELVCRLYLENKTQLTQAVKGELLSLLYADTRFEKVLRPLDVGLTSPRHRWRNVSRECGKRSRFLYWSKKDV